MLVIAGTSAFQNPNCNLSGGSHIITEVSLFMVRVRVKVRVRVRVEA